MGSLPGGSCVRRRLRQGFFAWGNCFTVLIQIWQQMLTCKHDTSAAISESAVNRNRYVANSEFYVYKIVLNGS